MTILTLILGNCKSSPAPVEVIFDPRTQHLPFPSDLIHTAYGLGFTEPVIPWLSPEQEIRVNRVLPGFDLALADLHGFSPNGPILVQFSDWIDCSYLPATPSASIEDGSPVILLNFDRENDRIGRKSPFRWKFDWENNVLVIQPWIPLEPGTKYLLVITDGLRDTRGNAVQPSTFFRLMKADYILNTAALEKSRSNYSAIFTDLNQILGLSRESVSLAVEFTTSASISSPLQGLINDTRLRALPVLENIQFSPSPAGALSYRGELLLPDYLDWKGHLLPANPDTAHYPKLLSGYRVNFVLTFPSPGLINLPGGITGSVSPPFPLVIVQPGWSDADSSLDGLTDVLARNGVATLMVKSIFPDPEHSYPAGASAGSVPLWRKLPGWNPEALSFDPLRFRDFILQSAAALSVVLQTLPGISGLDLYPRGATSAGDGIPDLDLARLGFFGELFGATAGLLALSQQTEILIGGFRRPGGGWAGTLFDNPSWSPDLTAYLQQQGFSRLDLDLFPALLNLLWDPSDCIYFPPSYLSEETGGAGLHHVLMQVVVPDLLVPASASFSVGRAYGIPLLLPLISTEVGMETQESPARENILSLYSGGIFEFPGSEPLHGEAGDSRADRQAAQFFSSFFYSGRAVIINPN
ncbi:MAG: Ig-like domain-containing protein [bacterium]|nr:Ig-like domain-containing protein [bacterium]